jgi:hypothetical protein
VVLCAGSFSTHAINSYIEVSHIQVWLILLVNRHFHSVGGAYFYYRPIANHAGLILKRLEAKYKSRFKAVGPKSSSSTSGNEPGSNNREVVKSSNPTLQDYGLSKYESSHGRYGRKGRKGQYFCLSIFGRYCFYHLYYLDSRGMK